MGFMGAMFYLPVCLTYLQLYLATSPEQKLSPTMKVISVLGRDHEWMPFPCANRMLVILVPCGNSAYSRAKLYNGVMELWCPDQINICFFSRTV